MNQQKPTLKINDKYYSYTRGFLSALAPVPFGRENAVFRAEVKENNKRHVQALGVATGFVSGMGICGDFFLSINNTERIIWKMRLDKNLSPVNHTPENKHSSWDNYIYDWIAGESLYVQNLNGYAELELRPEGYDKSAEENSNCPLKNVYMKSKNPILYLQDLKNIERIKLDSIPTQMYDDNQNPTSMESDASISLFNLPNLKEIDISSITSLWSGNLTLDEIPLDCIIKFNPKLNIRSSINNPVLENKLNVIFPGDFKDIYADSKNYVPHSFSTEQNICDILLIERQTETISITVGEFRKKLYEHSRNQTNNFAQINFDILCEKAQNGILKSEIKSKQSNKKNK